MSHRHQPSTASSSFAYSSFDPSSSNSPSIPQLNDYAYSYDHHSASGGGGIGGDYDYDQFESPAITQGELGRGGNNLDYAGDQTRRTKRNDSIFSISSLSNQTRSATGGGGREGDQAAAFQGEEYRNDPFNTSIGSTGGRRSKRYGLSEEDSTTFEQDSTSSDEDEEDLEVFNLDDSSSHAVSRPIAMNTLSTSSPKLGDGGKRHTRFEALTMQELSWMGVSALLTVTLLTGAVVVAVSG